MQHITILYENDTEICIKYEFVNGSQSLNKTIQVIIESEKDNIIIDNQMYNGGHDSTNLTKCIQFQPNMSEHDYRLIAYDKLQHNLSDLCTCPAAEISFSISVVPTISTTGTTGTTMYVFTSSMDLDSTSTSRTSLASGMYQSSTCIT